MHGRQHTVVYVAWLIHKYRTLSAASMRRLVFHFLFWYNGRVGWDRSSMDSVLELTVDTAKTERAAVSHRLA